MHHGARLFGPLSGRALLRMELRPTKVRGHRPTHPNLSASPSSLASIGSATSGDTGGSLLSDLFGGGESASPAPVYAPSPADALAQYDALHPATTVTGSPGAVPFRPGNWNLDASPAEYSVAQGDTMAGIAALYLQSAARVQELIDAQQATPGTRSPTTNGLYVSKGWTKLYPSSSAPGPAFSQGMVLTMPREAAERAKDLASQGTQSAPSTPGSPGSLPTSMKPTGQPTDKPLATVSGLPTWAKVVGAAAAAFAVGKFVL